VHKHNLLHKAEDLEKRATYPLSFSLRKKCEELDALRVQAVSLAEKQCRKLRMGQVSFSPAIQQARATILAWTLVRNKLSGKKISSRYLQQSMKKADIPWSELADSLASTLTQPHAAYSNYS
jgi:hypothetical protein